MGIVSPSLEVVMRPPEVFVRELAPEEGARLKSISKRAKYQSQAAAGDDPVGVLGRDARAADRGGRPVG
jgi:hypothetical protein